jgi:hypothetical protein
MHLIGGMHPQAGRLVHHTVHVKGVKVDALALHIDLFFHPFS